MRLIDADKLKQHFAWWHEGGKEADRQAEIFEQIIDVQPTAQQGIIRCKDCVYWDVPGYCINFMASDENGFCSWAERKTDETD